MADDNPLTPQSNVDIQKKTGCKFILYSDIHKVKDINELLPMTLILYEFAKVGHFVCVFENDEGLNYFDPLGDLPDAKLMYAYGGAHYHDYPYLVDLLNKSGRKVVCNKYKLQKSGTSTCGDWCTVRMKFKDLHMTEFAHCFKGIKNRDKLIANIFYNL